MNAKRILTGLASLVLAAGLAGWLVSSARASTVPVIYNYAAGWSYPQVRPAWIYVGNGKAAPRAHTWSWNTWSSKVARSTGTLWAGYPSTHHKLYVTLSGVRYHNGRAYYSAMTWYTPGYRMYANGRWSSTTILHFIGGYWRLASGFSPTSTRRSIAWIRKVPLSWKNRAYRKTCPRRFNAPGASSAAAVACDSASPPAGPGARRDNYYDDPSPGLASS